MAEKPELDVKSKMYITFLEAEKARNARTINRLNKENAEYMRLIIYQKTFMYKIKSFFGIKHG